MKEYASFLRKKGKDMQYYVEELKNKAEKLQKKAEDKYKERKDKWVKNNYYKRKQF